MKTEAITRDGVTTPWGVQYEFLTCADTECSATFLVEFDDIWTACCGEVFCPVCGGKVLAPKEEV